MEPLYQGSRYGWKASDFHDKRDNKGAKITVIRSTDGFIFGGYSDKSWTFSRGWRESYKSFLFSLKSPQNTVGPTNMRIRKYECSYAMCHISSYIPTFVGGNDLNIANDANNDNNSYSNIGCTYDIPPGQTKNFLVGSKYFKVSKMKAFHII